MSIRGSWISVAAALCVAFVVGCGEDRPDAQAPEAEPASTALALATEAADLQTRFGPPAESIARDPERRARVAGQLSALGSDASRLAGQIEGELEGGSAKELAGAAACLEQVGAELREAVEAKLGAPAQEPARSARSGFEECTADLAAAAEGLSGESGEQANALSTRVQQQGEGLDAVLGEVIAALAAPVAGESPAAEPSTPTAPAPSAEEPSPDLPPATGTQNETADLPECSVAPPPCR